MGGSVYDGKMRKQVEWSRGSVLDYIDHDESLEGRIIKERQRKSKKETGPWILPEV